MMNSGSGIFLSVLVLCSPFLGIIGIFMMIAKMGAKAPHQRRGANGARGGGGGVKSGGGSGARGASGGASRRR
jgi:hypothetical protein